MFKISKLTINMKKRNTFTIHLMNINTPINTKELLFNVIIYSMLNEVYF